MINNNNILTTVNNTTVKGMLIHMQANQERAEQFICLAFLFFNNKIFIACNTTKKQS